LIIAWRDRDGGLNIMFLGDGRVEAKREKDKSRWEIMMRNWDFTECSRQVNVP
jgi:hypothetical protein